MLHTSSPNSISSRSHARSSRHASRTFLPKWLSLGLAWGIPLSLTIFFSWLGFDAPLLDLITRWACVGLTAYLGQHWVSSLQDSTPLADSPHIKEMPSTTQLVPVHKALSHLTLPVLLQQFTEEICRLLSCRSALLILLDRQQESPEHVITVGQAPSSAGQDLKALLPTDVFLEALEQRTVIFNTSQELRRGLGSYHARSLAQQSLFVGSIRHHQHLAFLLLADRAGRRGFLPEDRQIFLAAAEIAKLAIDNARCYEDLQNADRKHRDLLHGLINAQEQESKLVAHEWHDRINRKLFEVFQGLRSFHHLIAQHSPENEVRFQQLIGEIDGVAALVRGLASELHPSVLDDFGVAAAIREYVADVVTGVEQEPLQVTVQADEVDQQLPSEAKLLLFRITQEALRNIRKHAAAKNVQIAFVQEHAGVSLMIKDDGKGFNPSQSQPGHFGLQYMRERAEAYGGTFHVVSTQGHGTEVQVKFPSRQSQDPPKEPEPPPA